MGRNFRLLWSVAIVTATLLAYSPALRSGFIWDDDDYVTENMNLRDLQGLGDIWFKIGAVPQYYPLCHTTFWIEYQLWGLHPLGYHAVNILLHALNAILVWRILVFLGLPGSLGAAFLFALHPVMVESVAWVTERKNVLSSLFFLGSLRVALEVFFASGGHRMSGREWTRYLLSLFLFVLALLSKTPTCMLPFVIALLLTWKEGRIPWPKLPWLLPFVVVGGGLGLLTVWVEKHVVGAVGDDWSLSWIEKFLVAGRAFWFYLWKLAYPGELIFFYPRWEIDPQAAWQFLFPVGAILFLAALWWGRRAIGTGPFVAFLAFVCLLFPALGFFNLYPMRYSFVADHWQYLASIFPLSLFAVGLARLLERARSTLVRYVLPLGSLSLLLVLGILTWNQCHAYKDIDTLWKDTIAKNPRAWMAYNNYGMNLLHKGDVEGAILQFEKSLRIKADQASVEHNIGLAHAQKGDLHRAINYFNRSLEIDPKYAKSHTNLGNAYLSIGDATQAIESFRKALTIRSDPLASYNLGNALMSLHRLDEAMSVYHETLILNPEFAEAENNLGLIFEEEGQLGEAEKHFARAYELAQGNATFLANLRRVRLQLYRDSSSNPQKQ